jgi:uncharacterized protein (TIGR02996 family)
MEDEPFLRAISAAPDDDAPRLVYADWLDDRGDPRAEFVRLQVRLRHLSAHDPSRTEHAARERQLRAACPPYWLSRLDPPVWCVVGNIVDERRSPGGESVRGTRLFRPNAKVYLANLRHLWAVLNPAQGAGESVEVLGQHRKSRQWLSCWVRVALTTNWRVQLVSHPGVLVRLREAEWPGFRLPPRAFRPPAGVSAAAAIGALLDAINASPVA